jgi:hypothetical protein
MAQEFTLLQAFLRYFLNGPELVGGVFNFHTQ